jgi:hypothetical protein
MKGMINYLHATTVVIVTPRAGRIDGCQLIITFQG